jgi:hypothetical protein
MIRHETVTPLNYRMAVSGRSDFPAYNNFPEVYHAHGISKAPFSGGERAVTGRGGTQHIASSQLRTPLHLVSGPLRAGGKKIRNSQKPDLRGGKPVSDMIIKQFTLKSY